jgi:hypothetical protein
VQQLFGGYRKNGEGWDPDERYSATFIYLQPDERLKARMRGDSPVALVLELTPVVNLLFSALIVIVGLIAYGRTKKDSPLYVAGAFLLFGLSHFATLLGAGDALAIPLLAIRIIGYVLIIGTMYLCYAGEARE